MKVVSSLLVSLGLWLVLLLLTACLGTPTAVPASTSLPTLTACGQPGSLGGDSVPAPTQGFEIDFRYYLPPCYDARPAVRYPVLYLLLMPFEGALDETSRAPMSLAERLIQNGQMPPAIIIVPEATIGYGYHAALAIDLVPYVDGKFRTLAAPRYRGVGGISHGAAIAARMALEFPQSFGSLGLLSGGISASEMERVDVWIKRTPLAEYPRVLIKVGEQDSIRALTSNLTTVFDRHQFPYTLELGQGGHDWAFWSAQMESTLLWFADAW